MSTPSTSAPAWASGMAVVPSPQPTSSTFMPDWMPRLATKRSPLRRIVRASRVGNGIVARNGEAKDDEMDYVVSDTLNAQKARILVMLGLTKTNDTKEIQRMFYTY